MLKFVYFFYICRFLKLTWDSRRSVVDRYSGGIWNIFGGTVLIFGLMFISFVFFEIFFASILTQDWKKLNFC